MPNQLTTKLARKWAEAVTESGSGIITPHTVTDEELNRWRAAARDYLLAVLPEPTMADITWRIGEHTLAGATLDLGLGETTECVMLAKDEHGYITYITLDGHINDDAKDCFTPNGKRYKLVEEGTLSSNENVGHDQPEHPAILTTVEDYQNAPEGTVVDVSGGVAIHHLHGWGITEYSLKLSPREMSEQGEGIVIRWGWGTPDKRDE